MLLFFYVPDNEKVINFEHFFNHKVKLFRFMLKKEGNACEADVNIDVHSPLFSHFNVKAWDKMLLSQRLSVKLKYEIGSLTVGRVDKDFNKNIAKRILFCIILNVHH